MEKVYKKLELVTNVTIIVVALFFAVVLASRFIAADTTKDKSAAQQNLENTRFNLDQVNWAVNEKNLVLAFSTTCRFCLESTSFYKQLTEKVKGQASIKMIAVTPQPTDEVKELFAKQNILVEDVIQTRLSDVSINGTPTLLLIDKNGVVQKVWVGRLSPESEAEVMAALF